jgi:hypothetical protein
MRSRTGNVIGDFTPPGTIHGGRTHSSASLSIHLQTKLAQLDAGTCQLRVGFDQTSHVYEWRDQRPCREAGPVRSNRKKLSAFKISQAQRRTSVPWAMR